MILLLCTSYVLGKDSGDDDDDDDSSRVEEKGKEFQDGSR